MHQAPALPDPNAFATAWVEAWNARDVDAVLSHYTDDVVLSSPRARTVVPASDGIIVGKAALAAYWREALSKSPHLHFTLEATYVGVDALTLAYRNHRGEHVAETLVFDHHGHVTRVIVAHRPARASH